MIFWNSKPTGCVRWDPRIVTHTVPPAAAGGLGSCVLLLVLIAATSCRPVERSQPAAATDSAVVVAEVVSTETGFEMLLIPAGRFKMGRENGEADEGPVHEVEVDAFLIDRYEVTQELWDKLVLGNPSHFKGPKRPAEMISWGEAALFCNKRSEAEGLEPCYDEETALCDFEANGYRLPTEAEWEYACRAGSEDDYHFGPDPNRLGHSAWYKDNASKRTQPVGQKSPNAWGIFDMHGNVAEWCNDMYAEDYYADSPSDNPRGALQSETYVLRGGAWNCSPESCRASYRIGADPGFQDACFAKDAIGFRCARNAPEETETQESGSQPDPEEDDPVSQNKPARSTGFVRDDVYLKHETGPGHPECPQRLVAILDRLKQSGMLDRLTQIGPTAANEKWIVAVHTPEYLERIKAQCRRGSGYVDSPDVPVCARSYEVATVAVGGVLGAIDAVMEGKTDNAFCAVRPPGHHALEDRAMGFCLLNNVAIAARYIQQEHKLSKVLIVDWDVHHGNGTQDIFYDDPSVFYFGIHQYPFYPGSGAVGERGEGKGTGFTLNVPLPAGSDDRDYQEAFEKSLRPAAIQFDPDFVLISAGFDAHENDLLGGMEVTARGFGELTRVVDQIARECCEGRLVSVLEGGYGLEGLAASVEAHLRVLMNP